LLMFCDCSSSWTEPNRTEQRNDHCKIYVYGNWNGNGNRQGCMGCGQKIRFA